MASLAAAVVAAAVAGGKVSGPHSIYAPRDTGRGIVVHDGKILLIERWRPGFHYFSIPGGGIEAGESPEQTAVREIFEETTIDATLDRLVFIMQDGDIKHHIFLCNYLRGEPKLHEDAPEAQNPSPDNRFEPVWSPIDQLSEMTFTYWDPLKIPLIDAIKNGFPETPLIVSINQ